VAATEYRIDDGDWTSGRSVTVRTNGDHTLSYRSTDNAGNLEATQTCHVRIDTRPPATTPTGVDALWHATDVTIGLHATDAASGVAQTGYSIDGGASWTVGDTVVVKALADHTDDGLHVILFRSTDVAGNTEAVQSCTVRIDTVRPTTRALSLATVRRGFWATLRYRADDPLPNGHAASVMIKVKTLKGKVVKTLRLGLRPVNRALTYWYHCTLPRGTYGYFVYATDLAGNKQASVGSNRLSVR
jgi:hypothetical protein